MNIVEFVAMNTHVTVVNMYKYENKRGEEDYNKLKRRGGGIVGERCYNYKNVKRTCNHICIWSRRTRESKRG